MTSSVGKVHRSQEVVGSRHKTKALLRGLAWISHFVQLWISDSRRLQEYVVVQFNGNDDAPLSDNSWAMIASETVFKLN